MQGPVWEDPCEASGAHLHAAAGCGRAASLRVLSAGLHIAAYGLLQAFHREVVEAVGAYHLEYLVAPAAGCHQFAPVGAAYAVRAGVGHRGRGYGHVHLGGACPAHQAHKAGGRGAPDDGVVHQDDALAGAGAFHGVQLRRTPSSRWPWAGLMNVRPRYLLRTSPRWHGMPLAAE